MSTISHTAHRLPNIRAVVFDAYGTLFDVHAAVSRHAAAIGPDAGRLSEIWRGKQLEYSWVMALARQRSDFWTLTQQALDHALARMPQIDRSCREPLLDAYRVLDAYPEVAEVLGAVRAAGLKTAILSNGTAGMLAEAVEASGLTALFDAVISVDEAATFKTDPATYTLIERRLGAKPAQTLFVSSNRWDVAGATAFGLRCLWVNRAGMPDEYPGLPPVAVAASLDGLPKLIAP
jgi:2-haloacid dehalogenase